MEHHSLIPPLLLQETSLFFRFYFCCVAFQLVKAFKLNPGEYDHHLLSLEDHIYFKVIQETHDDDSLDQASAALFSVFRRKGLGNPTWPWRKTILFTPEIQTLLHLLSPEASYRTNRGAAESIVMLNSLEITPCGSFSLSS